MAQTKKEIKAKPVAKVTPDRTKMLLAAGAILLVTFLAFSAALKNGFINWDDNAYVFDNAQLSKPFAQATSHFFGQNYFIGNYIPLTMMVYWLEHKMSALDPHFYHSVNLLIHLVNVLLVFVFAYRLSGKKILVAGFVALVFGIHPTRVESVAWIAELKDVLYTLFFISGLIVYLNYLDRSVDSTGKAREEMPLKKKLLSLAFVLLLFLCSLLSKPAAVVFPFVLLLLDFYRKRKFNAAPYLEKIPFLLFSVVFGIVAIAAQQADRLIHNEYNYFHRILFASHSLLDYLFTFFLPFKLAIFYPYPDTAHLPLTYYLAPFGVLLLFFLVYRTLKQSRLVVFGFLFFLVNLLLVLQFISVGDAIKADRYTYIPYIGLSFVLAMVLEQVYQGSTQKSRTWKPVVTGIVAIFLLMCVYLTYSRCKVWKDDDAVATDLLNKHPEDWLALNNKGFILHNQGRYNEAIALFTKATDIKKDYVRAYINLANSYVAVNDLDNALRGIDTALKYEPGDYNLLNKKGFLYVRKGNYDDAIKTLEQSIALKRDNLNPYVDLSQCYYLLNQYDKGIAVLDRALKYDAENYILLNNKGYFLYLKRNYKQAENYFLASLKMKPDYSVALQNLSDCQRAVSDSTARKN